MQPALISATPFLYKGRVFVCAARPTEEGLFQPVVMRHTSEVDGGAKELPHDSAPYASVAEAVRHAEQQAIRWTHDLLGEGQAKF